ncbi:50S ribosomal protein L10 [Candidatus Peregrinibacteria bacterium]|nr:50S ribosomal protein L10 [Candidatus Peregrinibacteria bacterium]
MPVTKQQKSDILKDLIEQMKAAKSVIFADYQGLTVKDVKNLRKQLKEKGVKFQVAKRTLFNIAAKETGYGELPDEVIQGPVGAAFSMEDQMAAASLIYKFAKKNKNLKLRGALFDGRVLSIAETKVLATMPSKEELIGKLLYLIKYPIQGFHGVLNNTVAGFVRALNAIAEQKGKAA